MFTYAYIYFDITLIFVTFQFHVNNGRKRKETKTT